ncbi:MAG TPA: DUF4382 domain-containing protein [Methanoregulaceae archaeon]|nr:DUF4382 domain-containing protein [Methanoregulaceae archaeon]
MERRSAFLLLVCLAGAFILCSGCTQPTDSLPNATPSSTLTMVTSVDTPLLPPPTATTVTPVDTPKIPPSADTPSLTPTTLIPGDPTSCTKDSDCVPAQCCHPTGCVNIRNQPDCSTIACTQVCQGPIDCGAGHCGCVNGTCSIIPGPASTPDGQATLKIAVKDAPKIKDGGTITHLWLNISEVSVHRAVTNQSINESNEEMTVIESEDPDTAGWITVIKDTTMVDLMEFVNMSREIGQNTVDPGRYTQIRLKIDSGTITVDGINHDLSVPSGVLKLNRGFDLDPEETLTLTLDFNVDKSVIRTGSDQYKLKPVIAVLSDEQQARGS